MGTDCAKQVKFTNTKLSPREEVQLRLSKTGNTILISDNAVAALCQKQREVVVRKSVIAFDHDGVLLKYHHPNSFTCQPENEGKKFLISYSQDFLDAVHVLDDAGKFIETVPSKGTVEWFNRDQTSEAIAKAEQYTNRAKARLEQLKASQATDRAQKLQRDCDRIETSLRAQIVNTFEPDADAMDARPTSHTSDESASHHDPEPSRDRSDTGLELSRACAHSAAHPTDKDRVDPADPSADNAIESTSVPHSRIEHVGRSSHLLVQGGATVTPNSQRPGASPARETLSDKADAITAASNRVRQIKEKDAQAKADQQALADKARALLATARKSRRDDRDADDDDDETQTPRARGMALLIARSKAKAAAAAAAHNNEEAE